MCYQSGTVTITPRESPDMVVFGPFRRVQVLHTFNRPNEFRVFYGSSTECFPGEGKYNYFFLNTIQCHICILILYLSADVIPNGVNIKLLHTVNCNDYSRTLHSYLGDMYNNKSCILPVGCLCNTIVHQEWHCLYVTD